MVDAVEKKKAGSLSTPRMRHNDRRKRRGGRGGPNAVHNAGGGNYDHFKLGMKMGDLASLFSNADNSYARFLSLLKAARAR